MMKHLTWTTFSISVFFFSTAGQALHAVPCAPWSQAEAALRQAWPSKYPGEKILSIAAAGEPSSYEKMESTGKTMKDAKGDTYEYLVKVVYCRVPAKVTAQRANGSQAIFDVSAIYKQTGSGFAFYEVGVSGSSEVASDNQKAPSKDEIKKMVAAHWVALHPNTKVEKVALSDPELNKDSSAGRWWYYVGADIYIVDEDGEKKKCSNDYTTVYKGEQGKEGVNASGPWKINFFDDPVCN